MTRLSIFRLAGFSIVAAASWLGCVDDSTGVTEVPICPRYCDEVEAKCKGINYKDRDQCLATCALMKPGNEETVDDTAGCRLAQARAATKDDPVSCKKASAYGGSACGEPCSTFCNMVDAICISGSDAGTKPYTSESSCFELCKTTPLAYDPASAEGPQAFEGADTLNCRMFHLMLALDDRAAHCPHTEVVSATCRTR